MTGEGKTPKYAVRLVVLIIFAGIVFFGGLQFFVPEGSKLTGSYDAKSLKYIASAPVSYAGSESCGTSGCHEALFNTWVQGAHGARAEKSKCEVCHGPQGNHPEQQNKLVKVRGDGDLVELCLSCHRKLKARSTTGQPQIVPQEHPYPHEGTLNCIQCHNPHDPGMKKIKTSAETKEPSSNTSAKADTSPGAELAASCFSCHGESGRGGFAPILAGQQYEALKEKLVKFKSGEINSPMMNPIVSGMKDEELDMLAKYFAGIS
jgi:cytochrome c553